MHRNSLGLISCLARQVKSIEIVIRGGLGEIAYVKNSIAWGNCKSFAVGSNSLENTVTVSFIGAKHEDERCFILDTDCGVQLIYSVTNRYLVHMNSWFASFIPFPGEGEVDYMPSE